MSEFTTNLCVFLNMNNSSTDQCAYAKSIKNYSIKCENTFVINVTKILREKKVVPFSIYDY